MRIKDSEEIHILFTSSGVGRNVMSDNPLFRDVLRNQQSSGITYRLHRVVNTAAGQVYIDKFTYHKRLSSEIHRRYLITMRSMRPPSLAERL